MSALNIEQLLEELIKLRAENKELKLENMLLRQKVDLLVRKVFGSSSEKFDSAQLTLLGLNQENVPGKFDASSNNQEEAPPHLPRRPVKAKQRTRPRGIPEHLPVVEEILEPEEVQEAPEKWRQIGQEVSDQLDYTPGRFFKRRLIRRRYVSRQDQDAAPVIAELPAKLLERGQIAPGLLAHVIVSKYCDHLPLYRQEQIYWQRHGVWLPRQRMAFWLGIVADWVKPIYRVLRSAVMAAGYVQIDETPVRYLVPKNGRTKAGYFWTACRPKGDVFYHWEVSRAGPCLKNVVPVDFRGIVQCDGYAGYNCLVQEDGEDSPIKLACCWAHARRKFYDSAPLAPKVSAWVLVHIQNLYRIEEELRETGASPKLRAIVRAQRAVPIYRRLIAGLEKLKAVGSYLPRSGIAQAINYTLSLKQELGCIWRMAGWK